MAATSLGLVLLQRAPKCAVDELCSAHAMAFRGFVEPPRQGLIKRHVAVRLGAHRRHQRTGQEVGHRGIGEHGFGRSRRWMGLPLQMKRQRLAGIAQRFIEVVSGRETARNIRDDYPERAPGSLCTSATYRTAIPSKAARPYARPACLKIARTVPIGRSFLGCGTVTLPALCGCRNW